MTKAVAEYRAATAKGPNEAARQKLVLRLTKLRLDDLARGYGKRLQTTDQWQAIDREIARHPMPVPVNSQTLAESRQGKWGTYRHEYLYRANGTWTMLPEYLDGTKTTSGWWRIEGNQFRQGSRGWKPERYTVILTTPKVFVYADRTGTFYEEKL